MSTIPSAISSVQTSTFNGTSQYAGDLQQAINQAVAIASIPLTQLQTNVTTLQNQSAELSNLHSNFNNLLSAIQQLSSASGTGALAATVADSTIASVTVNSATAATAGTYDLNVISAGSSTTTLSSDLLPKVSDAGSTSISTSNSFTLTLNGTTTTTITPSGNTLNSLAQAINSANAGVTATILNVGPPSAPDYRLSLESTSLGADSIQLNDGSQDLLTPLTTGTPAKYQIDGQPSTPISSNSSSVVLAPGITASLLHTGDTTVTVAADNSAAASALSSFASAYNSTLSELSFNHGTNGGALTGQGVIQQLQQSLSSLVQYAGGGNGVQGLADLGLTFSSSGQLTFDQSTFDNAEATNPNGVASFLGSTTTGGFLQNADNVLSQLESTTSGVFTQTAASYQQQINADNEEATATQARITTMQNNLTAQMTQADATIAALQSQVTYFTTLFSDEQNISKNLG
jgi:flagellar hook-associated protein 2